MKIEQLSLPLKTVTTAKFIEMGTLFLISSDLYMRVKPVSWMLNSTLIQDKITRGYVFAVNMETGKLGTIEGSEIVEPVTGTLKWTR